MRKINEQFENLPKEYFAQKFTNPAFPPMGPGIGCGAFCANFIFYIVNLVQISEDNSPIMKYTSIAVMIISALMLVASAFWGKKRIARHKVGYIRFNAWIFGDFRLQLLSVVAIMAASIMSNGGYDTQIVAGVYIGTAVLLAADIVLNIVFWEAMKRRIIEGAFKEGAEGFFGGARNNRKINSIFRVILLVAAIAVFALGIATRVFDMRGNAVVSAVLGVILIAITLVLSVTFAYADALLLGKAHYVGKFGTEPQTDCDCEE